MELVDYLPIALLTLLGLAFAGGSLFLSRLIAPSNPTPEKLAPRSEEHTSELQSH